MHTQSGWQSGLYIFQCPSMHDLSRGRRILALHAVHVPPIISTCPHSAQSALYVVSFARLRPLGRDAGTLFATSTSRASVRVTSPCGCTCVARAPVVKEARWRLVCPVRLVTPVNELGRLAQIGCDIWHPTWGDGNVSVCTGRARQSQTKSWLVKKL